MLCVGTKRLGFRFRAEDLPPNGLIVGLLLVYAVERGAHNRKNLKR